MKVAEWQLHDSCSLVTDCTEAVILLSSLSNLALSNGTIPDPYGLLLSKIGVRNYLRNGRTGEAMDFKFGRYIRGVSEQNPIKNLGENGAWRI